MSTPSYLVVEGDDGGLDAQTDAALLEAGRNGVLTSVGIVANAERAFVFAREAASLGLGLGLHFNITEGPALAGPYRTLTDARGYFPGDKNLVWERASAGALDVEEIAREARAQFEALAGFGFRLDHVNGHNHVQMFPVVLEGLLRAGLQGVRPYLRLPDEPEALEAECPTFPRGAMAARHFRERVASSDFRLADRFCGHRFCCHPQRNSLGFLDERTVGVTEWMVHPGRRNGSSFTEDPRRLEELSFLVDPATLRAATRAGYQLVRFGDIP